MPPIEGVTETRRTEQMTDWPTECRTT